MALSQTVIRMNYAKAIYQANRLEDLARQLRNIAQLNLDSTLNNVNRVWSGEAASVFLSKGVKAKEDMLKTANSIDNTAKAIRRAAEVVRAADIRAMEIARRMSGG